MNPNQDLNTKSYEGWLYKQVLIFKFWSKRWFILKDNILIYYFTPTGKIKGSLSLKDSKIEIDPESKRHPGFKIITPKKIYRFQTDTEEELNEWMNTLMIANGQKIAKIGLNDFDILKVLGRGSLGKVQLVRFKKTNKLYALKSMSKAKLKDIKLILQTINEKNALVTISHPFIVSSQYAFQTETYVFIAMEYIPGGELLKQLEIEALNNNVSEDYDGKESSASINPHSLISTQDMLSSPCLAQSLFSPISLISNTIYQSEDKLDCDLSNYNSISYYDDKNYGGFDVKRARLYAAQLALAIQYIHSIGFIHRDLKPSNILIDKDGYIKLIDFGFVKEKMFGVFAKTSTFCGTPMYTAPEIIKRKPYGRSVDWWSFGVILYEMLFYNAPFFSQNLNTLFELITNEKLTFPSKFSIESENRNGLGENEISFVIVDFLRKLLEKDPQKRLGTYDEEEIFSHPFFEGIEWKSLLTKKVQMDWKPQLKDENDVSCFYDQFTNEEPQVSVIDSIYISEETNEAFTNFTYIDTDGVLSKI